jgi:hypothetical protein
MMSATAKRQVDAVCAWGGYGYIVILVIAFGLVAGFLPPHRPSWDAAQIADIYRDAPNRIRAGMVLLMIGTFCCLPFTAVLCRTIARIEGGPGPLTYAVLMGGIGNAVLTFYPAIFWLVAAYRPDRPDALIYLMNDLGWLQLIGGATLFWTMPICTGIASLCDGSPDPVFPRWSGYTSIFLFLCLVPDQLLFFFHSGPFAWNGLFGIWLPLISFAAWFFMTSALMLRAIGRGIALG